MNGLKASTECNFGDYFATLDKINIEETKTTTTEQKCCDDTKNYVSDEGVIICKRCGTMINNIMDTPEWKFNGTGDSKGKDTTRCGMPMNPLLPKSSMGTYIGGNKYGHLQRLHSWNAMPYKERSQWKVYSAIATKCKKGGFRMTYTFGKYTNP